MTVMSATATTTAIESKNQYIIVVLGTIASTSIRRDNLAAVQKHVVNM